MKTYRVMHREIKDERTVDAESAAEACQAMGWMPGDCFVKEVRVLSPQEVEDIEAEKQARLYQGFERRAR